MTKPFCSKDILITLTDLELPLVMSVSHDRVTRVVVGVEGGAGGVDAGTDQFLTPKIVRMRDSAINDW